jgi:hypothetical protein
MKSTTIIAFDQHAATTMAAVLLPGHRTPALHPLTSDIPTILRFVARLQRQGAVTCCFEAGPCGFELQRALTAQRIAWDVIAPGLDPTAARRSHQNRSARRGLRERGSSRRIMVMRSRPANIRVIHRRCRSADQMTGYRQCPHPDGLIRRVRAQLANGREVLNCSLTPVFPYQNLNTTVAWNARAACWLRICRKFGLKRSLAPL